MHQAWIIFVGVSNLLSFIFITIAIVQPTPAFGTSVLFSMRSFEEASLIRRSFNGDEHPILPHLQQTMNADAVKQVLSSKRHFTSLCPDQYQTTQLRRSPKVTTGASNDVPVRTRLTTTFTTTTATSLITAKSSTRSSSRSRAQTDNGSGTASLTGQPVPSKTPTRQDTFVALYVSPVPC